MDASGGGSGVWVVVRPIGVGANGQVNGMFRSELRRGASLALLAIGSLAVACAGNAPPRYIEDDAGTPPDAGRRPPRPDGGDVDAGIDPTVCEGGCDAPYICAKGTCILPTCDSGQKRCDGFCVDLNSDPSHCGTCEQVCPATTGAQGVCQQGKCALICNGDHMTCKAPQTCAPDHCCDAGKSWCGEACTDTQRDVKNCGECGLVCTAPSGQVAACVNGGCEQHCLDGRKVCNGVCVDVTSDVNNCGDCDTPCEDANGGKAVCHNSECAIKCTAESTICPDGKECVTGHCCEPGNLWCSASNACADITSDVKNCGKCGGACRAGVNELTECVDSMCINSCDNSSESCGTACVNLSSDPANCGSCGHSCGAGFNCSLSQCIATWSCSISARSGWQQCGTNTIRANDTVELVPNGQWACGTVAANYCDASGHDQSPYITSGEYRYDTNFNYCELMWGVSGKPTRWGYRGTPSKTMTESGTLSMRMDLKDIYLLESGQVGSIRVDVTATRP